MFTGIIEEVGTVVSVEHHHAGARIAVRCSSVLADATLGASIAVNGTCLTAVELSADHFASDLAPETLKRSNLGDLTPGMLVNLERPLRANGRLDGHFVQGHVDAVAEVVAIEALGDDNWFLQIRVPLSLARYIVEKGSLAVNGISLTVAGIQEDIVDFAIIPHTYEHTNLKLASSGSRMNIEVDMLAKHLEKLAISR